MILAVLQARTSSRRLPQKVLRPILGRPMIALMVERVRRARRLDGLVLATSAEASDDPLAALARELGIGVFRGALDDVLDRFYRAAAEHGPEHVVRLTGDCPLADPALIDRVVAEHLASGADCTSNAHVRTFPDGLDVEVLRFAALEQAWREARAPHEREHVTPFVYAHPERFRHHAVTWPEDLSAMRWTVDTAADFALVAAVFERLHPRDPAFAWTDVIAHARAR
jgi:spore coat polysaccharide biosynthesis protein SpsF